MQVDPALSQQHFANARSKLGRAVAASLLVMASSGVTVATEAIALPSIAHADSIDNALNAYPDISMPCEHSPYNVSGSCANYDWGPVHTAAYNDPSEISPRGYAYRNCTDWVAWREATLAGVTVPKNLTDGGSWADNAASDGIAVSTTPEAWDAAVEPGSPGHVAFVESVSSDGSKMTISEYNHDGQGDGDQRTITVSGSGFTKFVDFGKHPSPSQPPANLKADLVVHNADNTWSVAGSTGTSFSGQGIGLSGWGKGDWTGVGDVTGDGKADIVVHNPDNNTFSVAVNDGSGNFDAAGSGTWLSGWSAGDWVGLADVNGDHMDDLVVYNPTNNSFAVALSTGHSFSGSGNWLTGWGIGDYVGLADVTGDGKADLVVHNPSNNSYDVAVSTGSSFTGSGAWLSGWGAGDWVGLGDVTGDGKADLVVHSSDNTWAEATSTGSSFAGSGNWLTGWGAGDWTGLADVTGDGKADIIVHNPDNNTFSVAQSTGSGFNGPTTGVWLSGWGAGDWAGSANLNGN